jgi:outer membrane lipoprotein-sorting protein
MKRFFVLVLGCGLSVLAASVASPPAAPVPAPVKAATPVSPEVTAALARLEKRFAGIKTVQTGFVQEKSLAVFDQKMILKGKIALECNGRFAWRVTEPVRYTLVMTGTKLKQWDEDSGKVQEISMTSNPVFQAVFTQLQCWFSGRFQDLARDFTVSLVKDKPLTLAFVPKSAAAGKAVKQVTVILRDDERYVGELKIEEVGGDVTVMTFEGTKLDDPIPASTWEIKSDGR